MTPTPPPLPDAEAPPNPPDAVRGPLQRVSLGELPYRRSNASLSKLFESTASLSTSRPSSGAATPTPSTSTPSAAPFSPGSRRHSAASAGPPVSDEYRTLIQRAFVPHVAVVADAHTDELVRAKGVDGGLLELLRPFGEAVPGNVTVRDSIGASKSHADFGVRFVGVEDAYPAPSPAAGPRRTGGNVAHVEELVDRHLQHSEFNPADADYLTHADTTASPQALPTALDSTASPFYTLYLRRLLSGLPIVPHESFAHPVAGIIAISSRNPHPIEELRRLYNRQHDGDLRFPQWVENDFLRYYVLVHDEETGDIAKSNQTFDSMKRHFGLHCHLLRLKSQHCIPSDDDSVRMPSCEWISASEELAEIQRRETADDITDPTPYFPDSDISSLRTFIRELVTQSIIPNMERSVSTWNEQILSRRRGLSGRFMSLSKRWTPFGTSRSSSSSPSSSNSNYDSVQGFYKPDTPEAIMRRLADYCFMLRDWKLALSTYEILRTDFQNDKAWRHYAGASEMAAMSALMAPAPLSSKSRSENIDTWIEAASYSYTDRQRSAAPYYALRTLTLTMELLRIRGSSAADDAARWGTRILDSGLVGAIGHALITERISACYTTRPGIGMSQLGSRRRKAALWAVLAAQSWWRLSRSQQAEKALDAALRLYNVHTETHQGAPVKLPYPEMQRFVDDLRQQILALRLANTSFAADADAAGSDAPQQLLQDTDDGLVDEATETLDGNTRAHRQSLIGSAVPPLSPARERAEGEAGEGFE